ncbi:hypothetical protein G6F63_016823 [Rhizopus arrhizus]|nr:hypothetical protein G6F63_016823 [Rhizopus arrhizus]
MRQPPLPVRQTGVALWIEARAAAISAASQRPSPSTVTVTLDLAGPSASAEISSSTVAGSPTLYSWISSGAPFSPREWRHA